MKKLFITIQQGLLQVVKTDSIFQYNTLCQQKSKMKNHMIIPNDAEKATDKIQQAFMIKNSQ